MKYLIGGFDDSDGDDITIIDMAPETEYREDGGVGKYIQVDIRRPLPTLPLGGYIEIGRVLRYIGDDEGGYLEDDKVDVKGITNAITNVLKIAADKCCVEIEDHLAVAIPAIATLCNAGFHLDTMILITSRDEDLPSVFNFKLTRDN